MNNIGPNVPEHLDQTLGVQKDQNVFSYEEKDFWILEYSDQPDRGACSYITVGLGRHLLTQDSGSEIRQEFMITVWDDYINTHAENQLASLSLDLLDRHIPVPNNQVIPWQGAIFEKYEFSAMYCTSARHMTEEFEMIESEPNLVFVWLIPIYPEEQNYIQEVGWSKFENLVEIQQPDFFDLERPRVRVEI